MCFLDCASAAFCVKMWVTLAIHLFALCDRVVLSIGPIAIRKIAMGHFYAYPFSITDPVRIA